MRLEKRGSIGIVAQRVLTLLLLVAVCAYLGYEALRYYQSRRFYPAGMTIGGVLVTGLSRDEAARKVGERYMSPLIIYHQEERAEIPPAEIGFQMDLAAMMAEAENARLELPFWEGYVEFLLGRTLDPVDIPLVASHDSALLRERLEMIASYLDKPSRPPLLRTGGAGYQAGEPGFVTDIEASLPQAEAALYKGNPAEREVALVITPQEALPLDMNLLKAQLQAKLDEHPGLLGSVFVVDLRTGEEIGINADVALSGLSILKIAIFVEAYRALDGAPSEYVEGLFYDTAVRSSNYGANLLLHVVAGADNTYEGAAILTEAMKKLGLDNTFMAIPYDAPVVSTRPGTYSTPANSVADQRALADPARQTTAEDIGSLLSMIYYCANGGGPLLAVYPAELTPGECQAIIDLMVLNLEGNLIRFGVPEEVPVSHKHGWDGLTYGDAGIVLSPGGDYVIVTYVHQPIGWLAAEISFPILWDLSRITYNYFNFTDPYLEDPVVRAEREVAALEALGALEEEPPAEGDEAAGETGEPAPEDVPSPTSTPTATPAAP